jgi:hypothetical protein
MMPAEVAADETVEGVPPAIKAASIAAVATDPALVVAISPNNTVGLSAGTNAIGKLAANAGVTIGAVEIAATQTLGAVTTVSTVTNLSQLGGAAITMGTGVRAAGTLRVTIATDDVVQTAATPQNTAAYAPSNATTTVYATSLVIKASAGTLYAITGYNSKISAQFVQVHNATALPANTAVPVLIFTVPASSNFSLDLTPYGRYFTTGITVCNSSTGPTLTVGAADCWFDAQYK